MNAQTQNPQPLNTLSGAAAQETLDGVWPFDIRTWPAMAEPVYRTMPRGARFALGRIFRDKAKDNGHLTPAEHLLYALLKGKNPFLAFSPVKTPKRLGAGELAWGSFMWAAHAAAKHLDALAAAGQLDGVLHEKLRQLLLMARLRALGMTIRALPASYRTRKEGLLKTAMSEAPQGRGSVKQHCEDTYSAYCTIVRYLTQGVRPALPVPAWLEASREPLRVLAMSHQRVMRDYLTMHDCGKPFSLRFDDSGRPHYPAHAALSARVWLEMGGSAQVASLIARDMDLHTLKAEDASKFAARPDAPLLLLSGLASLHANAADFGGVDSDSFKIKLKRLTSRGTRIAEICFRPAAA